MQRSITTYSLIAGIIALVACTREEVTGIDAPEGGHHAYIQEMVTRAGFDVHDGKFSWTEGDRIAIHMSDGTWQNTEVDYRTGAFSCETTDARYRDGYAIFPASIVDPDNVGNPVLNIILPSEYDITGKLQSNEAPLPMVAVNSEDESDLYFCHVGGLLRLTCNAVPVGTKRLAVTLDRNIAGTFQVSRPDSQMPSISGGGSTSTVYYTISENGLSQKTDGIVLNIPVPTGNYNSLTVTPLDNAGNEINSFTREINFPAARQWGKKFRFSLTEIVTDSMQLIVTAGDETGWTYTLPFARGDNFPADLEINWGDESSTTVNAGTNVESSFGSITHSYSSPGDYTITITGTREGKGAMIPSLMTWDLQQDADYGYDSMLKSVPTPVLTMATTSSYNAFSCCYSLESISNGLFSKNPQLTGLIRSFYTCHRIQAIPEGLLNGLPNLRDVSGLFQMYTSRMENIGITPISGRLSSGIPAALFSNNPELRVFTGAFYGCDGIPGIPENLFENNTEATSFESTFRSCSGISGPIPSNLFVNNSKATMFNNTFSGCSGLTGPIPENLFSNNPDATGFDGTFQYCRGLTGTIPGTLFTSKNIYQLISTFDGCSGLTGISPDLFANQTDLDYLFNTFYHCTGILSIPEDLFATCPNLRVLIQVFTGCSALTEIPENLLANNPEIEELNYTFGFCESVREIPENLFAHNPKVSNFRYVIAGCHSLTEVPAGLFAHNPLATNFSGTFYQCYRLQSIPEGIFANNPLATDFSYTFLDCSSLAGGMSSTLFANNLNAYDFTRCFEQCGNLRIDPDVFSPADRFSTLDERVVFDGCFYNCGNGLTDRGTAPELWNYVYGNGVSHSNCFYGADRLSNYSDIPDDWK